MLTLLRVAWRNLWRNRKRTALALAAITLAQFCVLAIDGYMSGYGDAMRNLMTGPMLGHFQIHAQKYRDERSMDLVISGTDDKLRRLRQNPEVTNAMPRLYGPALAAKTEEGFMAMVIGVDPKAEHAVGGAMAQTSMKLAAGNDALSGPRDEKGRMPAVVGAALAKRQKLSLGDELALVGQTADGAMAAELVLIVGIIKSNLQVVSNMGVLIDLTRAQEAFAMPDQVHEIVVRGNDPERADELAATFSRDSAFGGLEILPWRTLAPEMVDMIEMMDYSTLFMLVLVFLAAAAGVANTMLMSTFERTREMGMLLALGTGPRQVIFMIVAETIMLGAIGIFVGTLLGAGWNMGLAINGFDMSVLTGEDVDQLTFQGINFDFRIYPRLRPVAILQGLTAMGITSLLSCLWPASYVTRLQPTEAMR